jgi:hypothetical protein
METALPFRDDPRGHPLGVREPLELRSKEIVEAEGSKFRQASRVGNRCWRDYAPVA